MPTILVVDDEPDIRNALRRLLVARGFEVVEAGSAAEGVARAATGGVDAILCDIMMPGGSGLEFFDLLRASHPELTRRFVFLTAAAKEAEISAQVEARNAPLLSKLYELDLAVDAITVSLLQQ
ncbi:MAG TPA: response regulator [Gemmatimonadales bacterium]|nr:response regulator [Gemmatimonadales bacterium]